MMAGMDVTTLSQKAERLRAYITGDASWFSRTSGIRAERA